VVAAAGMAATVRMAAKVGIAATVEMAGDAVVPVVDSVGMAAAARPAWAAVREAPGTRW
jgi:hypothetical protein